MTENEDNMDSAANLRAGGNINLGGDSNPVVNLSASSTGRVQRRMRQAIKEYAYAYTHALYKNFSFNESAEPGEAVVVTESKQAWQWWQPSLVALDALVYGGIAIVCYILVKVWFFPKERKVKEEEAQ